MIQDLQPQPLPIDLYCAEQVRKLDRLTIEQQGVSGYTLMRRAGKVAFDVLQAAYGKPEQITIFCGVGNNAGDGYVVATLARQRGMRVLVVQCGDSGKISGDALQARQHALQDGVEVIVFDESIVVEGGVIVDAVLGTGLKGPVRSEVGQVIEVINQSDCQVVSIDIPSGLCADTGMGLGKTVYAQHTVSYIGCKQGLLTADGPSYTGQVYFSSLQVPKQVYEQVAVSSQRLALDSLKSYLPPRSATAHKGMFGHVMVTGGDSGMAGAAAMASQTACRVGAGLTSCVTRPEHLSAIVSRCPEIMVHGVNSGQEFEPLLAQATVIVVGPGLGQNSWGEQLLQKAYASNLPMVMDADALNILAQGRVLKNASRDNWILTPHPGEAARLLACSVGQVMSDRFAAVKELQQCYGGAVVLKGAGTLVADADYALTGLSAYGNSGMASGGMGDVLSGVLGALLAQGLSPANAARLGVCLHGRAADLAAGVAPRGMLATDLIPHLRELVN